MSDPGTLSEEFALLLDLPDRFDRVGDGARPYLLALYRAAQLAEFPTPLRDALENYVTDESALVPGSQKPRTHGRSKWDRMSRADKGQQ